MVETLLLFQRSQQATSSERFERIQTMRRYEKQHFAFGVRNVAQDILMLLAGRAIQSGAQTTSLKAIQISTGYTPPTLKLWIDRLAKAEYLAYEAVLADARLRHVRLTRKGGLAVEKYFSLHR